MRRRRGSSGMLGGLLLALPLLAGQAALVSGRTVQFALSADWPTWALSPLQETSEYLATEQEDGAAFWAFVDGLASDAPLSDTRRDVLDRAGTNATFDGHALVQVHPLALSQANAEAVGLHRVSQALLELYLGMGALTPTVELHRTLRKGPAFDAALAAPEASGCTNTSISWLLLSPGPQEEGTVLCSPDLLAKRLEAGIEAAAATTESEDEGDDDRRVLSFDHVYPTNATAMVAETPRVVATLYAAIGTSEFARFHALLKPQAQAGELRYVLRHFVPGPEDARSIRTPLQGYGIYLDIKNMEYKNLDESQAPAGGQDSKDDQAEVPIPATEEVAGLCFATLIERQPALSTELRALRRQLQEEESSAAMAAVGGGQGMKAWRMRDFGLQAVELLRAAKDPLHVLMDLSQGFPSFAESLLQFKVNETTRHGAMAAWERQVLGYGTQLKPGTLFINGLARHVNTPTFNVFDLLEALREEVRGLQQLARLPVPTGDDGRALLQGVLKTATAAPEGAAAGQARLDIYRGYAKPKLGPIVFLNNLDSDPQYQRWPKTLRQLLFPSWQLQVIARNTYSLTLVLDLEGPGATQAALAALAELVELFSRSFPVRISVLFASRRLVAAARARPDLLAEPSDAATAALLEGLGPDAQQQRAAPVSSAAVGLLYHDLIHKHGAAEAGFPFIMHLAGGGQRTSLSLAEAVDAYAKAAATAQKAPRSVPIFAEEGWAVLKDGGVGLESVRLANRLVAERGLPLGCYLLNGLLQKGLDLAQTILQLLSAEQQHLAELVAEGVLTDGMKGMTILGKLLEGPDVHTRYHPAIEEDFHRTARASVLLGPPAHALAKQLVYWHPPALTEASAAVTPVSVWLVADLSSARGLASAGAALSFLRSYNASSGGGVRLAVIHNPSRAPPEEASDDGSAAAAKNAALFGALLRSQAMLAAGEAGLVAMERLAAFLVSPPAGLDLSRGDALDAFAAMLREDDALEGAARTLLGLLKPEIEAAMAGAGASSLALGAQARAVLGQLAPGEGVLVVNGRHVPLGAALGEPLHPLDLHVVVKVESARFSAPLHALFASPAAAAALKEGGGREASDLLMAAHSFLNVYAQRPRVDTEAALASLRGTDSEVLIMEANDLGPQAAAALARQQQAAKDKGEYLPPSSDGRPGDFVSQNLRLAMLLDPLSETAQRISPFLLLARDHLRIPLTVLLAPHPEISEFPLKSYYRLAMAPRRAAAAVSFERLPRQHVLTTRVDAPEPWNVQTRWAVQDLDNLKCDEAQCGDLLPEGEGAPNKALAEVTRAELGLKNLLVYGQCFDWQLKEPVNGLQLTLADAFDAGVSGNSSHHSDTLVMQNYGFFQLSADPGVWSVRLAEGRARELYEAVREGADGALTPLPGQELLVFKRDFTHSVESLRVRKRAGMEEVPLLDDISTVGQPSGAEEGGSMLSSLSKKVFGGGGDKKSASDGPQETVHVFSLATGHLYERMLKIMMLSVSKRTSAPVKFWLLENFLSPAFKTVAAAMADTYGFEVEFITYKWPDWLRQQTEKQRIIWGYKILFLDVLFPLSVKKVIYVDADQVVRADLKELWDMDLKGHPYGYTPFCDSREETLGFQFWRSGYWANHLAGKPYHISALYVVDLARFRQMAVGDKLRAIYDQLSRDPNSLANLDQDLPNYAQHMVPIFSLPQEWLWCESWCSDASKARAKTIDLCNNPQHKEPKLDMARRVISGPLFDESWVELDAEVKRVEAAAGLLPNATATTAAAAAASA